MNARRLALLLFAISLAGCDNLLGLKDIQPDGAPAGLLVLSVGHGVVQQPVEPITVSVVDVRGIPVNEFSGEIKLAIANNTTGANLVGTTSITVTSGTALFDVLGFDKEGTYTLVASTDGLPTATSVPIVIAAPAFRPLPTGIAGGPVASVAVSPAPAGGKPTVFLGANDAVYQSIDNGATWKSASFNADAAGLLLADPTHPGVLYFHNNFGSSLKKTVNGGVTWIGLDPTYVSAVALSPAQPSVVYTLSSGGLRRSPDGGATWEDRRAGASRCSDLIVDAGSPDVLYCSAFPTAGGTSLGVYKSTDGGVSWAAATTGLPAPYSVRVLAATPQAIFAANDAGTSAMYRSIDGGGTWTSVLGSRVSAVAYAPSLASRVYAATGGVARSNDGGATFGTPAGLPDAIQSVAVDPTNPDVVYAGGFSGVYVSTNGGTTWTPSSRGFDAHPVQSLVTAAGPPSAMLASVLNNVLRSTDGGTTWASVVASGPSVWLDSAVKTRVYSCNYNSFGTSTNSGATFTFNSAPNLIACNRLVGAGATLFAPSYMGLARSLDAGATWTTLAVPSPDGQVSDAAVADLVGNTVLAASRNGLYRSTNAGTSFTLVLDRSGMGYSDRLIADPQLPTRIVFGQCSGIRLSTDGGATFGGIIGNTDRLCVQRLWSAGTALYVYGTDPQNQRLVETSTDGGSSWTPVDISGIPAHADLTSVALSDDGKTVYLGTNAGIYRAAR